MTLLLNAEAAQKNKMIEWHNAEAAEKLEQIEWHTRKLPKRLKNLNKSSDTLTQCRRGDWNTEPQSVNVLKNTERKKKVRYIYESDKVSLKGLTESTADLAWSCECIVDTYGVKPKVEDAVLLTQQKTQDGHSAMLTQQKTHVN